MKFGSGLIDAHSHINKCDLSPVEVVELAKENGVTYILNATTGWNDFLHAQKLLDDLVKSGEVGLCLGCHPISDPVSDIDFTYSANSNPFQDDTPYDVAAETIKQMNLSIMAVGEIGLDYSKDGKIEDGIKNQQLLKFRNWLKIADALDLPVVIHNRNADLDILRSLDYFGGKGVIHCFSSTDPDFLRGVLKKGFMISCSGIFTFGKSSSELLKLLHSMPINRILVETDAPYLSPHPLRGKKNYPHNLPITARYIANYLNIEYEEFVSIVRENFVTMFNEF